MGFPRVSPYQCHGKRTIPKALQQSHTLQGRKDTDTYPTEKREVGKIIGSKVPKTDGSGDMMLVPNRRFFGPHIKGFISTHDCPLLRSNSFIRPAVFPGQILLPLIRLPPKKIAGKVYGETFGAASKRERKIEKDELWPRSRPVCTTGVFFSTAVPWTRDLVFLYTVCVDESTCGQFQKKKAPKTSLEL